MSAVRERIESADVIVWGEGEWIRAADCGRPTSAKWRRTGKRWRHWDRAIAL